MTTQTSQENPREVDLESGQKEYTACEIEQSLAALEGKVPPCSETRQKLDELFPSPIHR